MSEKKKVRLRQASQTLPTTAVVLLQTLEKICLENGLSSCKLSIPEIPLSLNHQKKHVIFRSKHTGKMVRSEALKDEVRRFRAHADPLIRQALSNFKVSGTCAAIIIFESSRWLTKELTVRIEDCDNKIKPVLDSIQCSSEFKDETVWEVHGYKMLGKKDAVHVWLFDLGSIVDWY